MKVGGFFINMEKDYNHEINLRQRKEMTVNGVVEVISFDEENVQLITDCGEMYIEGEELRVDTLDKDRKIIVLNGRIDAVYYSADITKEKHGFLRRLLK